MLFESLSILCVYNNSRISFYTLILAFRFLHRSHFVLPIINTLEKVGVYKFVFNYDDVKLYKVTAEVKEKSIPEILDVVLQDIPLAYKVSGEYVLIRKKDDVSPRWRWITGKVVDENNTPLPGVTVMIKELKIGGTTSVDGTYRVGLPEEMKQFTIVFSFVGMETKEIIRGKRW